MTLHDLVVEILSDLFTLALVFDLLKALGLSGATVIDLSLVNCHSIVGQALEL